MGPRKISLSGWVGGGGGWAGTRITSGGVLLCLATIRRESL